MVISDGNHDCLRDCLCNCHQMMATTDDIHYCLRTFLCNCHQMIAITDGRRDCHHDCNHKKSDIQIKFLSIKNSKFK